MHCTYLAELAGVLSANTPSLRTHHAKLSDASMVAYWSATRSRLDLWDRCLARHRDAVENGSNALMRHWWGQHRVVLEEIFVGEILCRVMAALASTLDRVHNQQQWAPVTETVYKSHLDVSNRVSRLLLHRCGATVTEAVRLNRLRIAVQHWSDALVGRMCEPDDPDLRYAADPIRARQIARESADDGIGDDAADQIAAGLFRAAMSETLRQRTSASTALPRANEAVARSVLLAMQSRWFDDCGLLLPRQLSLG